MWSPAAPGPGSVPWWVCWVVPAFPLSLSKTQALLDQLLGVEISRGAIATIRQRLSAALAQPMAEALDAARQQPVAYVVDEVLRAAVETGAPTGNADGGNPRAD